jgi:hypothetical protein
MAVIPAVGLAVAGAGFIASTIDWARREPTGTRGVGTPGLKQTPTGGHVRWQSDAVQVVLDKSFTEIAGPKLFGAAVDAWRATGASLPSISTKTAKDRHVGYKSKGENDNVVVYAPTGWSRAKGALAVTILTYEEDSGRIIDADVLLNGGGRYFAVFDTDESSGDLISIDGSATTSSSGSTTMPHKTAKFDVQSVITHELGHFFGLGEDYEDAKATMYVSTRYGEIHKRVVTKDESNVIAALYTEGGSSGEAETRGGCAGARLARPGSAPSGWIGFVVAALGLSLYAMARRTRFSGQSSVAARRTARVGGWLTVVGLVTSLAPPTVEASTDATSPRGDAEVEIVRAQPQWIDGLVETELTYRVTACHVASCPDGDQRVVILGGKLDGVTQIVGPFGLPKVGDRVAVGLRDHRGLLKTLGLTFQP